MLCRKHWRHIAVAVAVVMELALVALDRQIIQQLSFIKSNKSLGPLWRVSRFRMTEE